jgi:hypothetical protein
MRERNATESTQIREETEREVSHPLTFHPFVLRRWEEHDAPHVTVGKRASSIPLVQHLNTLCRVIPRLQSMPNETQSLDLLVVPQALKLPLNYKLLEGLQVVFIDGHPRL